MAKGPGGIDPMLLWGAVGAVGVAVFATQNKQARVAVAAGVRSIMDQANRLIFAAQLPAYARNYASLILRVADEQGVDPFLLFGIGDRETLWGSSSAYKQQTGDWTPRCRTNAFVRDNAALYKVVGTCDPANTKVMPADGLGWGRGIAQIDWEMQRPWCQTNNWRDDYTNLSHGAKLLKGHLAYFAESATGKTVTINESWGKRLKTEPGVYVDPRPMWGTDLNSAALSAYNAGRGTVLYSVAAGRPADYLTTGADYAVDTIRRAEVLASNYEKAGGTGTA